MRNLHIIMPMAGEGRRFAQAGVITPKPLIKVNGRYLFERALKSLKFPDVHINYSFIVRLEHILKYNIDRTIRSIISDANIHAVAQTTRGAVETALLALPDLSEDEGLIILDCDLQFISDEYCSEIRKSLNRRIDEGIGGILLSFPSSNPRYSYALVNDNGNVVKTAEKQVISDSALCGAYYFSNVKIFHKAAMELLTNPCHGAREMFISLLYNHIIGAGHMVKLTHTEQFDSFGTPEELAASESLCFNE